MQRHAGRRDVPDQDDRDGEKEQPSRVVHAQRHRTEVQHESAEEQDEQPERQGRERGGIRDARPDNRFGLAPSGWHSTARQAPFPRFARGAT